MIDIEKREGRLAVTLRVEDVHTTTTGMVDTVVIEHGTKPDTDLYDTLAPQSINQPRSCSPISSRCGHSRQYTASPAHPSP